MAISYGIVSSKGDMGRVYDVNMASADTTGSIDFTQTVDGASVGLRFDPTIAIITPMSVTLTAAQVLAANGGSGTAGTYANSTGTTSQSVGITSLDADGVDFAKGGSAAASFRFFVGRLYQPHAT